MSKQDQRAAEGSIAVQSGGDTHINQGISSEVVCTIIREIAAQIPAYSQIAATIVDERLKFFENKLIEKASEKEKFNTDSFKDPDFQYLIRHAQHYYARSGDQVTGDILIDIIAARSKEEGRTRLSLSLNEAAQKATLLTLNEFSELTLCYLIRYTSSAINNRSSLSSYLNKLISLSLTSTKENSSLYYAAAHGCGSVSMMGVTLENAIGQKYGHYVSKGITNSQIVTVLGVDKLKIMHVNGSLVTCINDTEKYTPSFLNASVIKEKGHLYGFSDDEKNKLSELFEGSLMNSEEIIATFKSSCPGIEGLFELWNDSNLQRFELTPIGMAIAHANAARFFQFNAPLSEWVK